MNTGLKIFLPRIRNIYRIFSAERNFRHYILTTGGMGTTIFYIIGAVLVLAAGIVLVTKKRMSSN